jgi:hypothetical protein
MADFMKLRVDRRIGVAADVRYDLIGRLPRLLIRRGRNYIFALYQPIDKVAKRADCSFFRWLVVSKVHFRDDLKLARPTAILPI